MAEEAERRETLAELREQIGALFRGGEEASVVAGHLNLGPDLWLSCDPAGRTKMLCRPGDQAAVLQLGGGDSGAWAALGLRLPRAALERARYLGLRIGMRTGDIVSFTPTLRYYLPDEMVDVPTPVPVILAGGPREHLSYIPVDHDLLDRARGAELNLFFHTDSFVVELTALEPLLMI